MTDEERQQRIHHHMYETCEGIAEHAERIVALEELCADMRKAFVHGPCYRWCEHMPEPCNGDQCQYVRRMDELGIPRGQ